LTGNDSFIRSQVCRAFAIIGSDIAVFETTDLNPNVMIEMSLRWGTRALPIRRHDAPKPAIGHEI
jgi:hypothetical protein